ncbi:MAG: S8 family peptidase [candidate division Zixibacteria bacterium]|nr:S8 family peptidase [candidate division Zixibacteria bacterium]
MKMKMTFCILAVIFLISTATASEFAIEPRYPRIAPRFDNVLSFATADKPASIWVFFTDKGIADRESYQKALSIAKDRFTEKALERRHRRTLERGALDYFDIPVSPSYVRQTQELGLAVTSQSRWLNAVSGYADYETIQELVSLPFVAEIRPVAKTVHHPVPDEMNRLNKDVPEPETLDTTDYGPSYRQSDLINVPLLHKNGFSGKGEMIAIFDTGFELDHPAFDSMNWTHAYNFIDDNEDVSETPDHGTSVLSLAGGFERGQIIGPAFGADFILARTEKLYEEDTTEERFWIEAAEWADSLGATIISSSLGYLDWYEYEDLDGMTAPITVAADIAVSRGIAVFNSAGNQRCPNPQNCFYYVTPPADGFGVMAIGSVDSLGVLAGTSSAGPTYDGRLKPEIVTQGVNTYAADYQGGYRRRNGTSSAAPQAAGAAALILEANPDWTPTQLREAMMRSGNRHDNPDNLYGHGLLNAFKAAELLRIAPIPMATVRVTDFILIPIEISRPEEVNYLLLTAQNLPDSAVLNTAQLMNGYSEIVYWGWPQDVGSRTVRLILTADVVDVGLLADTAEFVFRVVEKTDIAAGPNPFTDSLTIFIDTTMAGAPTDISVHAINGEKVWDAFTDTYNSVDGTVVWYGTNNQGREVASGVYYIVVRTVWSVETVKVFKK